MATVPPGFTFKPSDEELVNHYLRQKLHGNLPVESNEQHGLVIPDHFIIPDLYIFDYDPRQLQEIFRELSLAKLDNGGCYFFCPRRNKYSRGHEENRSTPSGYWKSRGKKQIIRTSEMTAEKLGLTFYQGQQRNSIVTEYIMHQYRLISNMDRIISPQEMPYDLCHIFKKKTKLDPGGSVPICNEGNSSTSIISTAKDQEIYISQTQSDDHQGDQTIELENSSSLPPMYHHTNEVYSTQDNYNENMGLAFPSTNYAYEGSYNSQIPVDHQVDQTIELEENSSSLPPMYHHTNEVYPTQDNYDVNMGLVFPSTNFAYEGSYNSQIPVDHQVDQTIELEETYSSLPPMYHHTNEVYSTQDNYNVKMGLVFPSTNYAYEGSYNSQIPVDHQVDQTIELEETYSSLPPMYHHTNEVYPTQDNYNVNMGLVFPSTNYAYEGSYNSQIPVDHQVDQTIELEETYSSLPPMYHHTNEVYSTQDNYNVNMGLVFPSTNYAYEGSYNSQIDHQVDQSMDSEELYSSLPPLIDNINMINPPQLTYGMGRE